MPPLRSLSLANAFQAGALTEQVQKPASSKPEKGFS